MESFRLSDLCSSTRTHSLKYRHSISLCTGQLEVEVDRHDPSYPLEVLCDFAARVNPKRGFLFVSKVLGRHIPVSPQDLSASWKCLAAQIGPDLARPVVFFGFAETAIALAHGVYRAWYDLYESGQQLSESSHSSHMSDTSHPTSHPTSPTSDPAPPPTLFLHSTRYYFKDKTCLTTFSEPHSHAPNHMIYEPDDPLLHNTLKTARTLVLIDDEASTGSTLNHAYLAFAPHIPQLQEVVNVVLTRWSKDAPSLPSSLPSSLLPSLRWCSLLSGSYSFTPDPHWRFDSLPVSEVKGGAYDQKLPRNDGRFGLRAPLELQAHILDQLNTISEQLPHGIIVVLGAGECVTPQILIAEALERRGHQTQCIAVSRSPIYVGGAIQHKTPCPDPYHEGVAHFVHNLDPEQISAVIYCSECPTPVDLQESIGHTPFWSIYLT